MPITERNKDVYELQEKLSGIEGKRFESKQALEEFIGVELSVCGNDLDAVNLADFNLMGLIPGYDIDIYFLYDRHLNLYVTEYAVNTM